MGKIYGGLGSCLRKEMFQKVRLLYREKVTVVGFSSRKDITYCHDDPYYPIMEVGDSIVLSDPGSSSSGYYEMYTAVE